MIRRLPKHAAGVGLVYTFVPILAVLLSDPAQGNRPDDTISNPAIFRVTTDVVNASLDPFTATIGGFGNSLIHEGGGFEPVIIRTKLMALDDSPNRVVADPAALTHWDTLREGFFDGAMLHIYRIVNGSFRLVREAKVAAGGSHASGWIPITDNRIIPPDTTRFRFRWDGWNRPHARYYFTVRALDKYGNLSVEASAFDIDSPEKPDKAPSVQNVLVPFRPVRTYFSRPQPIPAPKYLRGRLSEDGILTLEWDAVSSPDLAGYILYRSDYPPQQHSGYFLQLTGAPASIDQHVKTGDMVIVSKKIYSPSRKRQLSNRVWGTLKEKDRIMPGLLRSFPDEHSDKTWSLVPHPADTPVEEAGETCLKVQLGRGTSESLMIYNHGSTGQHWYDVLEKTTYTVEVWLRQEGHGTARFRLAGFYGAGPQKIEPTTFAVSHGWKKYVAHFTPSVIHDGAGAGAMVLELTGPATFYVDNFRVYRTDTAYQDFLPRELEAVKSSGMSALRTHGLIKTGIRTYDMEQLTNYGGVISGTPKLNTLPQILNAFRKAGVRPWLQIEPHMSPQEWLAFVEYMAAPYNPDIDSPANKPWAHKRHVQGQTKPWTEEFDRIYLELGNETWNGLFAPWTFSAMTDSVTGKHYTPGQVYGLFQEYVRSVLHSSPYWQPANLDNRFIYILGGHAANVGYGRDAASVSPSSDVLTIAAYNGGWDQAEDPPKPDAAGLFNLLADVNQSAIPLADRYAEALSNLSFRDARRLRLGTYEAGPGYALNGLNNAHVTKEQAYAQEQAMKSLASGTATLDAFLARAYRGFVVQNFFTFGSGDLWTSHAKWYHGGQAYPSWKLLALFNNVSAGSDMLRTETLSVPSVDLGAFSRRQAVKDAPMLAVYATRRKDRYSVYVISRKVPGYPVAGDNGYTPVTIELPFSHAQSITLYRTIGAPDANNLLDDIVKIEKFRISLPGSVRRFHLNAETGADERGLPPASTFLYVFDGIKTAEGH